MHFTAEISFKPFHGLRLKTFSVACCLLFLMLHSLPAQVADDFSDGDISSNPSWTGTSDHFVINDLSQLQLRASAAGTSWLSTRLAILPDHEVMWELWIKQSFAPSGANFGRIYLMSDQADPGLPLNGYYLQFGEAGSADAIELFRQSGTTRQSVCRAQDGRIAASFEIRLKITRSADGMWQLYTDYAGGTNFSPEASGRDNTHSQSSYFGIACHYTVSNAANFSFDDLTIRSSIPPDTRPPEIEKIEAVSLQSLRILFSESLDEVSAEDVSNYLISPGPHQPVAAELDDDLHTVTLSFSEPLPNGHELTLAAKGVADGVGNILVPAEMKFLLFIGVPISYRDVILTEIFADPEPRVGLPDLEFIELLNRSTNPVQLRGWRLSDGPSTGTFPDHILLPGHYVIVSATAGLQEYEQWGPALALQNFPTLNNSGDRLLLMDENGTPIDSLRYTASGYRDEDKASGGWTLERIDPENSCDHETNWTASRDANGGTPGKQNSVFEIIPDSQGPRLLDAVLISDTAFEIYIDEVIAWNLPLPTDIVVEPSADIQSVTFADASRQVLLVEAGVALDSTFAYAITVNNLFDCAGNRSAGEGHQVIVNADETAPGVRDLQVSSENTVIIIFSEALEPALGNVPSNYSLSISGHPASAKLQEDGLTVKLEYDTPFPNGYTQKLNVSGLTDLAGNLMKPDVLSFLYFSPAPVAFRDVRLTEILADPSPPAGLPEGEYAEMYNRSNHPVDLGGWVITDGTTAGQLSSYILLPGAFLILCAPAAAEKLLSFGKVMMMSPFPSLNNSGELLLILNAEGEVIDSVRYNLSWYRDDEKAGGGWSLEMIDPDNICDERNNWSASEDPIGGTPGRKNSIDADRPDNMGPKLLAVAPVDSLTLSVMFNETLEKPLRSTLKLSLSPQIDILSIAFSDLSGTRLTVTLAEPIVPGKVYALTVTGIADCPGNPIQRDFSTASFVLAEKPDKGDLIINEILFNPRPGGVDFVEIYNRSQKTIDLKGWTLRNVHAASGKNITVMGTQNDLMYPETYRVFTESTAILKGEYVAAAEGAFREAGLPAFNDDAGSVVLFDGEGEVIDSIYYKEDMHIPFLHDSEGVSLERIAVFAESLDRSNWRSSSSLSGFATPGYRNSNSRETLLSGSDPVTIEPEIIQPAVYGRDFAMIRFQFDQGGYIANIRVVDAAGRLIRNIAEGELLGVEGFLRWDGEDDHGSTVRMGYYLLWFEIFGADGRVQTFKKRVAVY